ncbi:hypothetical protein L204_103011 [Cryptococcus depauperatus]
MEEDKPPSTKDHSEHSMPPPASVNTTSILSTAQSSTRPLSPPRPSTDPDQTAAQPRPIHRPAAGKHSIIYNSVQRRNPVLACIRNVSIEIGDIPADYQVGTHNGVLFLSIKYHRLHPEYIHQRIEKMKNMYHLRIILVLCDVNQHQQSLRELTKIAIVNGFTLFLAWSNDEVAQYLVTFKQFEHKSADSLKERVQQTYHDQLQHVLTSGKKVNKTDADHLAAEFGSFEAISRKSAKVLSNVKGLGATKVTSLVDGFTKPFLVGGLRATASRDAAAGLPRETSNDPIDEKSPPAKRISVLDCSGGVHYPLRLITNGPAHPSRDVLCNVLAVLVALNGATLVLITDLDLVNDNVTQWTRPPERGVLGNAPGDLAF